jgi:hypothetical protein
MKAKPDKHMTTFEVVMKYLGLLMAFIYLTVGVTVMLGSRELLNMPEPYIVLLGLGLISYGVFRGYRLYVKYFRMKL